MEEVPKKEKIFRFTIDLPLRIHKNLKAVAAIRGKSMRELIVESIEKVINKLIKELEREK